MTSSNKSVVETISMSESEFNQIVLDGLRVNELALSWQLKEGTSMHVNFEYGGGASVYFSREVES